jgi:hypothetical protein
VANKEEAIMTVQAITPTTDFSGLAPIIGSAVSLFGMLILVASSAVHMMI